MKRIIPTAFPAQPFVDSPDIVGQAVRAMRTQSGLTMDDAAMLVGVSLQTLADIEAGRGGVSLNKLLQVLHGLGLRLLVIKREEELHGESPP